MSLVSLASLARCWLVAAVTAAGDGQNILPMYIIFLFIFSTNCNLVTRILNIRGEKRQIKQKRKKSLKQRLK
jgi:hypothetical protein